MPQPVKYHVMSISPRAEGRDGSARARTGGAEGPYKMVTGRSWRQPWMPQTVGGEAGAPRLGRLRTPVAAKR